ncbi:hypothetical protein GCM10009665_29450 [Kitasatospora nipponensis]|uniref:DUF4365 domain-containing protein n=1 Tax=Kitasatospora nipponensis TaxID=258049 RepID=A0ABN1W9B8_9ACTN
MKVRDTHNVDQAGVGMINYLAAAKLSWLCREQAQSDMGIDAHLEVVVAGKATGRLLAVQIKSGRSFFNKPTDGGWWFPVDDRHATYWLNHSLPVAVMLFDPDTCTVYWQHITRDLLVHTGKNWKILVPARQQLNSEAEESLAAPARPTPATDPFRQAVDRLPGDAGDVLQRARATDESAEPASLRLAQLLSGAADPVVTVTTLLSKPPRWMKQLPEAHASWAWHSVAAYACAHQLGALSVTALEQAARAHIGDAGRLWALAAIAASVHAPDRAPSLIASASDYPLLTCIAKTVLNSNGQPPADLPEQISQALRNADPAVEDSNVWRFIADSYLTAQRQDAGVEALEHALRLAPGDPALQNVLAEVLLRHSASGSPALSLLDAQRALRLATAARADFRRWHGPSAQAAQSLLRARVLVDDAASALRTALPAPKGEAEGPETSFQPLLLEGARIAIHTGLDEEAGLLSAALTDPGAQAQLAAVALSGSSDVPVATRVTAWQHALDTATDDDQRFNATIALTMLGIWPVPALDELRDQGAIAAAVYEARHASAEAAQGDTAAAIRRLRGCEAANVVAAVELIKLYQQTGDLQAAAHAADRAGSRFGDLTLRQFAVHLWSLAGQPQEARLRAVTLLSRPDLPRDSRLELRQRVVEWAFARQDWIDMEDHALAGLAENLPTRYGAFSGTTEPPELPSMAVAFVWAAMRAQIGARRLDALWRTYARFSPPVRSTTDVGLWLTAVDWKGWSVPEAMLALDLAERFSGDPEVSGTILGRVLYATGGPSPDTGSQIDSATGQLAVQPLVLPQALGERLQELLSQIPPDGTALKVVPATVEALTRLAEQTFGPQQDVMDAVVDAVRIGVAPMGMAARFASQPVALAFVQVLPGLIPAASADPVHVAAEVEAARAALNATVTLDISAIATATLIPGRFEQLRAVFATAPTSTAAYDDIVNTCYSIDSILRSSGHLGVRGGHLRVTDPSDQSKHELAQRAAGLSRLASSLDTVDVPNIDAVRAIVGLPVNQARVEDAWLAAAQHALDTGTALWCDDAALRQFLIRAGVPTFGTVALLHVLTENPAHPDFTSERCHDDILTLMKSYVVDLPVQADDLIGAARDDDWKAGCAAVLFARPGIWASTDGEPLWAALAAEVWNAAPDQLGSWYAVAAHGCCALVLPGQVADVLAALTAFTLLTVGVGPEPVEAIWPTVLQSLDVCVQSAARRHHIAESDEAETEWLPDGHGFRGRVRAALWKQLTGRQRFGESISTAIIEAALPEHPRE